MAGRRRALLVAVDEYEDEKLPTLAAPVRDALELAEVLGDESAGGFEVEVMTDDVTSTAICERVDGLLSDCRPGDVVLLHFACHGLKDDDGSLYLTARNTRPGRLISTAVDTATVARMMRRSRAGTVVLLLDCCYGGAFAKGVLARAGDDLDLGTRIDRSLGGGRGLAVITAASTTEWAFEVDGSARRGAPTTSVFTRALVDGIRTGAADQDHDGKISLGELYGYVFDRVKAEHPSQTPGKWEFNVQGDLYIARSPGRRLVEGELPVPVRELIASPYPEWRVGGVHELADLAAGSSLPLALAARSTLRTLADDDSRKVSVAAAEALARTEIRLSHTSVDLGVIRSRSLTAPAAASGEVRLVGIPLATASTVSADPGLRAVIDGDRVVITVAPSVTGPIDGTVTLSGPAGEASVQVTGWVAPDPRPFLLDAARRVGTLVGNAAGESLVLTIAGWIATRTGDERLAAQLLDRTPELLRAIADPADRAMLTALRAWVLDQADDRAGSRSGRERARASLPEWAEGDQEKGLAALLVDWADVLTGDQDAPSRMSATATKLVNGVTDPVERALCLAGIAWVMSNVGLAEQAASLLDDAVAATALETTALDRLPALFLIAWVWTRVGSAEQVLETLRAVEDSLDTDPDSTDRGPALALAGWLAAEGGETERSNALLTEARSVGLGIEDDYETRLWTLLLAAWAAAHSGSSEWALQTVDEVQATHPESVDAFTSAVRLVASAWIALIAGDFERHGRWLDEAKTVSAAFTDAAAAAVISLAIAWVRAQAGGADAGSSLVEAASATIRAVEEDKDLAIWSLVRTALAWIGVWTGAREQAVELLGEVEELIERVRTEYEEDDSAAMVVAAAAAYVAVQADDRERALRLMTRAAALAEQHPGIVGSALVLLALAWTGHAGERRPHRLLLDLVGVLVPTEYRTDRTETLLTTWTTLCRWLLAPT